MKLITKSLYFVKFQHPSQAVIWHWSLIESIDRLWCCRYYMLCVLMSEMIYETLSCHQMQREDYGGKEKVMREERRVRPGAGIGIGMCKEGVTVKKAGRNLVLYVGGRGSAGKCWKGSRITDMLEFAYPKLEILTSIHSVPGWWWRGKKELYIWFEDIYVL